jgi:hypothetical protein
MPEDAPRPAQAAIRTELGAIFVSLELSRKAWNNDRRTAHGPLNLALDCEHAHVRGHSFAR